MINEFLKKVTSKPLFIRITLILIVIAGIWSYTNLRRELLPSFELEVMVIRVIYPGASADEVELNAVVPVEERLESMAGINDYSAVCAENGAVITVILDENVSDTQVIKDNVYREITKPNLPDVADEVESLQISEVNSKLIPVISLGLVPQDGREVSDGEIYKAALKLEQAIESLTGVYDVEKVGYRDREIHVNVYPDKMAERYISLEDVVRSIRQRNVRAAGGSIQTESSNETIITQGQFKNPLEVGDVIVRSGFGENLIRVKDIADIVDDFSDEDSRYRVNHKRGVNLIVRKKEQADIVKTARVVRKYLDDHPDAAPEGMEVVIIDDLSTKVDALLAVVINNAIIGFILVLVVLFLFLDLRTAFWTAFGLPLTILLAAVFMDYQMITLNIMSLGAIITVLGMLVDHGIVIAEVVYSKKQSGLPSAQAVIEGVSSVFLPLIITIASTIAAFLPILFIKGAMGEFISVFPILITAMLIFSFLEAMIILPAHLAHESFVLKAWQKYSSAHFKLRKNRSSLWFAPFVRLYQRFLGTALRFRYLVVLGFLAIIVIVIALSGSTLRNFVLMWDDSYTEISVEIEAEQNVSLDRLEEIVEFTESEGERLLEIGELQAVLSQVGDPAPGGGDYLAVVRFSLVPKPQRERSADEIIDVLKDYLYPEVMPGIAAVNIRKSGGPPAPGAAVDIKISGTDLDLIRSNANALENYLEGIDGVFNVGDDFKTGYEEIVMEFDYEALASIGMSVSSVANTVRTAFYGTEATQLQTIDGALKYVVRLEKSEVCQQVICNLLVPNQSGRLIPIVSVTDLTRQEGRSLINHYNGDRVITVTADVSSGVITSGQVAALVKEEFLPRLSPGLSVEFSGEAAAAQETLGDLLFAFLMAMLFVYFIMVLLFGSASQPLLILAATPFGIVGALLAFTLHGIPLSFMGLIGIIGLMGVVVNDSVVMVDFINKELKENPGLSGRDFRDRISEGASLRLRPVLLTTITTVAGLLPTVYGIGGDAMILVPVVMAIAYGLLFASLITLVLIPALYLINHDFHQVAGKTWRWLKRGLFQRGQK